MKYEEYTANGSSKDRSPAEIESDLAAIRSEMSDTLHRLEEKFSPRSLIDLLFSRARGVGEGSGEFASNLGSTLRDNPVPVLLLATGVASLLAAERMRGSGGARRSSGESIGERLEQWENEGGSSTESLAERAAGGAESLKERARHTAGALGERAQIGERASAIRDRAGAMRERAGALGERAREKGAVVQERMRGAVQQARARASQTLHEEPLVLAGIGLAIGAILGASVPVTERERRAIGPTSERAIERTKQVVGEGVERAKELAQDVKEQLGSPGGTQSPTSERGGIEPR